MGTCYDKKYKHAILTSVMPTQFLIHAIPKMKNLRGYVTQEVVASGSVAVVSSGVGSLVAFRLFVPQGKASRNRKRNRCPAPVAKKAMRNEVTGHSANLKVFKLRVANILHENGLHRYRMN